MGIINFFLSKTNQLKKLKYKYYSAEKNSIETTRVFFSDFYRGDNSTKTYPKDQQTIVFMIDGRYIHGGLTDRLRGVVATYIWAKSNGYIFKINWVFPYRLEKYLHPNTIDWTISPGELYYDRQLAIPISIYDYNMPEQNTIFDKLMKKFVDGKHMQYHIYSNIDGFESQYSQAINELFIPSNEIMNEVEAHVKKIGHNFISITLRFQELLGDFKEVGEWTTLETTQQKHLISLCINKIKSIYNQDIKEGKLLVTSDSVKFLEEASRVLPYIYVIPGKLSHVDYKATEDTSYGHLKSFIDLFVLAKAKKSYLLVTGDMYRSNFAKYASILGGHEYQEIIF